MHYILIIIFLNNDGQKDLIEFEGSFGECIAYASVKTLKLDVVSLTIDREVEGDE